MPGVFLESVNGPVTRGLTTNSTATAFVVADSRPTTTRPVSTSARTAIDRMLGPNARSTLRVWPFGGNDNNDVVNVKVLGWSRVLPAINSLKAYHEAGAFLWISTLVCEIQATLSSSLPGVAGAPVVATDLLADTITLTTGIAVLLNGTADIDAASFLCDVAAFEVVTLDGDLGANGDGTNWLYQWQ